MAFNVWNTGIIREKNMHCADSLCRTYISAQHLHEKWNDRVIASRKQQAKSAENIIAGWSLLRTVCYEHPLWQSRMEIINEQHCKIVLDSFLRRIKLCTILDGWTKHWDEKTLGFWEHQWTPDRHNYGQRRLEWSNQICPQRWYNGQHCLVATIFGHGGNDCSRPGINLRTIILSTTSTVNNAVKTLSPTMNMISSVVQSMRSTPGGT